jgi:predicted nucleotidyltransferase
LNSDHVLHPAIAALFATEDEIPLRLRDDLSSALPRLGEVESAYIFGSAARGDMRPDSDIDVAVTLKGAAELPDEQEGIDALESRYGSRINVMPLRPRRARALHARIVREGIPLMIPKRRTRAS